MSESCILKGKGLKSFGKITVEGIALVCPKAFTFLGSMDFATGTVQDPKSPICGQSLAGKIFVFPKGVGSTVGPYVLLNLQRLGLAPKAMINRESDQITVAGASVARIPAAYAFDGDPLASVATGDRVELQLDEGVAHMRVWKSNDR